MGFALDVYGLRVSVDGDWPEVVESVRLDYAWFESQPVERPEVRVEIRRATPDFESYGDVGA
jgi:hypothetical protein